MIVFPKQTEWDKNKNKQAGRYTQFIDLKQKKHTSKTPWCLQSCMLVFVLPSNKSFMKCFVRILQLYTLQLFLCSSHYTVLTSSPEPAIIIFFLSVTAFVMLFKSFSFSFSQHMLRLHDGCTSISFTLTKLNTHAFPITSLFCYYTEGDWKISQLSAYKILVFFGLYRHILQCNNIDSYH